MVQDIVPEEGFEPSCPCGQRILSPPCLPFHHSGVATRSLGCASPPMMPSRRNTTRPRRYDPGVTGFIVGIVIGVSVAVLVFIVIGPSRQVRAERPLSADVEAGILLGRDPDAEVAEQSPPAPEPAEYGDGEMRALRRLRNDPGKRRSRS